MQAQILRGTNHIGGSIIKVTQGDTAILLDCGTMLPEIGQPKTEDNYDVSQLGQISAVFLTHHHGDHSGLLEKLPKETALYASNETLNFMNTLDTYIERPLRTGRRPICRLFDGESVSVGDLRITPFSVEHSAEGACMLLVEGGGKRLLYTGDFKRVPEACPQSVDLLITEGTMLTRGGQIYSGEKDVEEALCKVLRNTKGRVFILQSSANLPRIRTVVNARNAVFPNRPLMQDVFLKYSLEQTGHRDLSSPYAFVWNGFDENRNRTYDRIATKYCKCNIATSYKRIAEFRNAVVFLRPTMAKTLQKLLEGGMDIRNDALVFSMWRGYEKDPQTAALEMPFKRYDILPQYIHTSGHADREQLKKLAEQVKPRRTVCVHSENAAEIGQLCDCAMSVTDGDIVEV